MNTLKSLSRSLPSFSLPSAQSSGLEPPLDPEALTALAARRAALTRLVAAAKEHLRIAAKARVDPSRNVGGGADKDLAVGWVGKEMMTFGSAIKSGGSSGDADRYGEYMAAIGEAHIRVAELATQHYTQLSEAFLPSLETQLERHNLISKAIKEADKIGATYGKALKKGDEVETEAAARAYEDASAEVQELVERLDESIGLETEALGRYLEAELEYTRAAAEIYASTASALPAVSKTTTKASYKLKPPSTRMSRSQSDAALPSRRPPPTPNSRSRSSSLKAPPQPARSRSASMLSRFTSSKPPSPSSESPQGRQSDGSDEDDDNDERYNRHPRSFSASGHSSSSSSFPTLKSLGNLSLKKPFSSNNPGSPLSSKYSTLTTEPLPNVPIPSSAVFVSAPDPDIGKMVIALWRFEGESSGELPLEKGDKVRVEKVVNEEWWIGTMVEGSGSGRGMFPRAYTKEWQEELDDSADDESPFADQH